MRLTIILLFFLTQLAVAQPTRFNVLVLAENGGNHLAFTQRAKVWLNQLATDSNFKIDYIDHTAKINDNFLTKYKLFIQLDYPPFAWTDTAKSAFQRYMMSTENSSWIGFHHATLLGEFEGYQLWNWFSDFMGGIRFKNYIPGFAAGTVNVEQTQHPIMKGVARQFTVKREEWYTYDVSPRSNVNVLASVDERSYEPNSNVKMGDHPVIWTNPKMKAKNVYIFMGHGPDLFDNDSYQLIFKNAIFWAVNKLVE